MVNANGGSGAVYEAYPELYNMMLIAVGTTSTGNIHPSSSYPGDDTRLQERAIATDYAYRQVNAQGTSFSAARISEYAAGILSRWPHLNAQQASHDSVLFSQNDCGSSATTNCGTY